MSEKQFSIERLREMRAAELLRRDCYQFEFPELPTPTMDRLLAKYDAAIAAKEAQLEQTSPLPTREDVIAELEQVRNNALREIVRLNGCLTECEIKRDNAQQRIAAELALAVLTYGLHDNQVLPPVLQRLKEIVRRCLGIEMDTAGDMISHLRALAGKK